MKIKRNCNYCGKEFETYQCVIKEEKGKFCSKDCGYKGGNFKSNSGSFKKGEHRISSLNTQFKKGVRPHNWNGGRHKLKNGYIMVNCPDHPRAYRREVYEHILVAEKKLGRYLIEGECVHHINRIKDDNREENLMVFPSNGEHITYHLKNKKRKGRRGKWLQ